MRGEASMVLTVEQRLDSLEVRLNEMNCWNDRASVDLQDWTFNGEPWQAGQPWPTRQGIATISHPMVRIPDGWALEHTRLDLNLGGEGLLRICHPEQSGSGGESWGLDAFHRRFPLREPEFSVEASIVAR